MKSPKDLEADIRAAAEMAKTSVDAYLAQAIRMTELYEKYSIESYKVQAELALLAMENWSNSLNLATRKFYEAQKLGLI